EAMAPGTPTSPKAGDEARFLPEFLMGGLPDSAGRPIPDLRGRAVSVWEFWALLAGLSSSLPEAPKRKVRSGAPPVRSLYDKFFRPGFGSTPLGSRIPASFSITQSPLVGSLPSTPGTASSMFSPASVGQPRKTTLSPAQPDPFYTQGDSQRSEDQCDATWVTVFGFPQASASYILLRFAQYGNILKHVMSDTGNWMYICYQSKLQAQKALSKDGRIFGKCIRIGVKPCIDKTVMENFERSSASSISSVFTSPTKFVTSTPVQPANYMTRFPTMRPLAPPYKAFASDYQVI
ncbi:NUP35 protein, partial [Rynchops niger]|nr:NUP35 protein [Rynchops niger]